MNSLKLIIMQKLADYFSIFLNKDCYYSDILSISQIFIEKFRSFYTKVPFYIKNLKYK